MTAEEESISALLGSVTSPAAAADLVRRATESSQVFTFQTLVQSDTIISHLRESNDPQYVQLYRLLEIFDRGTYDDYKRESQSGFPSLSPLQVKKLKQLSIVTYASKSHILRFDDLQSTLDLDSSQALQELVISCIQSSLIDGQLDVANKRLIVSTSIARNVTEQDLLAMQLELSQWTNRTGGVIDNLRQAAQAISSRLDTRQADIDKYNQAVKEARARQEKIVADQSNGSKHRSDAAMDLDPAHALPRSRVNTGQGTDSEDEGFSSRKRKL